MKYNIIASGSKGNAVIFNDIILVDCGVAYKAIKPYVGTLKLVLLTHEHQDHFRESTVRRLAYERPSLRFGCGAWMVEKLIQCGVSPYVIDIYAMDTYNQYSRFGIEAFELYHNVKNCGYKIFIGGHKALYATDTSKITTTAKDYDLYMIEANYTDEDIDRRIQQKIADGVEYIYELKARENHLSLAAANEFILENAGDNSSFIFMHQHEGGEYA